MVWIGSINLILRGIVKQYLLAMYFCSCERLRPVTAFYSVKRHWQPVSLILFQFQTDELFDADKMKRCKPEQHGVTARRPWQDSNSQRQPQYSLWDVLQRCPGTEICLRHELPVHRRIQGNPVEMSQMTICVSSSSSRKKGRKEPCTGCIANEFHSAHAVAPFCGYANVNVNMSFKIKCPDMMQSAKHQMD